MELNVVHNNSVLLRSENEVIVPKGQFSSTHHNITTWCVPKWRDSLYVCVHILYVHYVCVHILYVHTYVSRLVRFSKCSLKKSADFNHLKSNPYSSISDRFVPPYFKMRAGL